MRPARSLGRRDEFKSLLAGDCSRWRTAELQIPSSFSTAGFGGRGDIFVAKQILFFCYCPLVLDLSTVYNAAPARKRYVTMQTAVPSAPASRRPFQPVTPKPTLLDQVRQAIRARPRTEDTYVTWIKRFIFFHGKRHPLEMGEAEIKPIFQFPFAICHLSLKVTDSLSQQSVRKIVNRGRY